MKLLTEVNYTPVKPVDGLVGFASAVFMESIYIGSIGVHTRKDGGIRLLFPKVRGINAYYPINKRVGMILEKHIYEKYIEYIR